MMPVPDRATYVATLALIAVDDLRQVDILKGGPRINRHQCCVVIAAAEGSGQPRPTWDEVSRIMRAFPGGQEMDVQLFVAERLGCLPWD